MKTLDYLTAWAATPEPNLPDLALETLSGDALEGPTRILLALGPERRELTTEEALTLAQHLVSLATQRMAQETREAHVEIEAELVHLRPPSNVPEA